MNGAIETHLMRKPRRVRAVALRQQFAHVGWLVLHQGLPELVVLGQRFGV
jgi:hypothetical protein